MVAFPYTKRLCSNNQVDQGSGCILCSVAAAERAGVPRDRWVFLHAGTDAVDHWYVSNRADLCSSPALRLAGRDALALAGIDVDDARPRRPLLVLPARPCRSRRSSWAWPRPDGRRGWGGIGPAGR